MTIAVAINELNEKGVKYKVEQNETGISMAFGLLIEGQKSKVEVIPGEEAIQIRLLETEREVDEVAFGTFLDTVNELRAIQKQEAKLVEALKA